MWTFVFNFQNLSTILRVEKKATISMHCQWECRIYSIIITTTCKMTIPQNMPCACFFFHANEYGLITTENAVNCKWNSFTSSSSSACMAMQFENLILRFVRLGGRRLRSETKKMKWQQRVLCAYLFVWSSSRDLKTFGSLHLHVVSKDALRTQFKRVFAIPQCRNCNSDDATVLWTITGKTGEKQQQQQ